MFLPRGSPCRVQLTTDGHKPYLEAVERAVGANVDYAMLGKLYGSDSGKGGSAEQRYSRAECTGSRDVTIGGGSGSRVVA